MTSRICKKCVMEKDISNYTPYKTKKGSNLYTKTCKLCRNLSIKPKGANKLWGRTVKKGLTEKELFEDRFVPEPNSGCWLFWHSGPLGYAQFTYKGKLRRAHRASWEIYNGSIPEGMMVCHKCDVRCCVNPYHLFLGTAQDNNDDMIKKGRSVSPKGENNATKLNNEKAIAIYNAIGMQKDIAKKFGVSSSMVGLIKRGSSWAHVTNHKLQGKAC